MSGAWAVFWALQLAGAACLLQPWSEAGRAAGLALFAVEGLLFAVGFLPVFLFQWRRRGRPPRDAARVTVEVLLDQLTGLVP